MKKILLGLFAVASVSAMAAEDINVYGRLGLDVYSHYNKVAFEDEGQFSVKAKGKIAPSIALEVTKDFTSNFEAGIGLGYVWHGKRDLKGFIEPGQGSGPLGADVSGKIPAVNSVPLYVTGKYKFNTNSDVKPYVKADLGYSFNRMKKSFDITSKDRESGETLNSEKIEGLKAKNGLYTAVGFGVEYNNVTADLSYVFTGAKIKISDEEGTESYKANNSAIRLTVGYKFSF